eukprot:1158144-Pelagomonas_calceolata.AAC.6
MSDPDSPKSWIMQPRSPHFLSALAAAAKQNKQPQRPSTRRRHLPQTSTAAAAHSADKHGCWLTHRKQCLCSCCSLQLRHAWYYVACSLEVIDCLRATFQAAWLRALLMPLLPLKCVCVCPGACAVEGQRAVLWLCCALPVCLGAVCLGPVLWKGPV